MKKVFLLAMLFGSSLVLAQTLEQQWCEASKTQTFK
jgi:hypothetical protein